MKVSCWIYLFTIIILQILNIVFNNFIHTNLYLLSKTKTTSLLRSNREVFDVKNNNNNNDCNCPTKNQQNNNMDERQLNKINDNAAVTNTNKISTNVKSEIPHAIIPTNKSPTMFSNTISKITSVFSNVGGITINNQKKQRDQHYIHHRIQLKPGVKDCDKTHSKDNVCGIIPDFHQKWNYKSLLTINNPCNFSNNNNKYKKNNNNIYNLVISIKSHCGAMERRDAVRKTWGNITWIRLHTDANDAKLIFLMGKCTSKQDTLHVTKEQEINNDMLQWNFKDSFRNLTV